MPCVHRNRLPVESPDAVAFATRLVSSKLTANLPGDLFANPVWHALQTRHRHFAVSYGDACRYPPDVAPFAAVATPSPPAFAQLASLMEPGEFVWLFGENFPPTENLSMEGTLSCLQMVLAKPITPPAPELEIVPLSDSNGPEMFTLINLAYPGFYRKRTYEMGNYYGIWSARELIAMGGERLMLDRYSEISGVCTHPAHRGKGFAAGIIAHLADNHRRDGIVSFLHVASENIRAIELYRRIGFVPAREVILTRIARPA